MPLSLTILRVIAFALVSPAAAGAILSGTATVIDGDTIEVRGRRIRLHGIDAPEGSQLCEADGKAYRCGQRAAFALSNKIGRAPVDCVRRELTTIADF
jgi:endonuclease YncB( thermonuclease family)